MEDTSAILRDLVGIKSVFPEEGGLARQMQSRLRREGFSTRLEKVQPGRFNLFAEKGNTGKALLFYGHLDTVPIYGKWSSDPLKLTERKGRLYGLGACDMKGGISAALSAARNAGQRKIKMLFCVDEENISRGAWHAVSNNRNWFSDVSMIISGDAAVSDRLSGGASTMTLGRRGRTVIDLEIKGLSSHGSSPERGVSAIDEAAKIIGNLKGFKLRRHPNLGSEAIFVREVFGASTSLAIPDTARLELDVQMVPPSTVSDAKARAEEFIRSLQARGILDERTRITISVHKRDTPYMQPFATSPKAPMVKKALAIMEKEFGKPQINYSNSVADDNVFANELGIPVIGIAPAGGMEHTANEWISKKSLEDVARLYSVLLESL